MATTLIRKETKKITASLDEMLVMVIENHDLAKKAIRNKSSELALKVLDNDQMIDAKYYEIESDLEFMITKAPVDKDLRRTLADLHIVREIERIGDYAKHIAKFVIKAEKLSLTSISRIDLIHKAFRSMLSKLSNVIQSEKTSEAIELAKEDNHVDELVFKTRLAFAKTFSEKKDKKSIQRRMFALNVVNALERASDHIVSICELISYIENGKHTSFS